MIIDVYKLTCLTNLHMGSGDTNFNVIDLEVERDPVLGEPTMHATGVKGALCAFCRERFFMSGNPADPADSQNKNEKVPPEIAAIFGSPDARGPYKFFSGDMLARPVRVSNGDRSYLLATTPELVNAFVEKLTAFGADGFLGADRALPDLPEDGRILCGSVCRQVEGRPAEKADHKYPLLELLTGGEHWALMSPKQLADIELPVLPHNVLEDGISKNLWYEQVVPHESVFWLLIGRPDTDDVSKLDRFLPDGANASTWVQFGAGASTGNGYVRVQKIAGGRKP